MLTQSNGADAVIGNERVEARRKSFRADVRLTNSPLEGVRAH